MVFWAVHPTGAFDIFNLLLHDRRHTHASRRSCCLLPPDLESFIARWSVGEGGQERANYALFLSELCDVLDVPRPDQASHDAALNAYAFERAVTFREPDGSTARGRIDLYKRGSFVLEAKQSRRPGTVKAEQSSLFDTRAQESSPLGRRTASRAWDVLMLNARQQAEEYAKALPAAEGWPPFLIVCDVGHCFEIYADFTGQGKNYAQFPDRQGFRIYLEELRQENIRERLRLIWLEPHKLDPTKIAAKATRDVAERLANVSKHLEDAKGKDGKKLYDPEAVALFLMRCLFTMFAEDVELLPEKQFSRCAEKMRRQSRPFPAPCWAIVGGDGHRRLFLCARARRKKFNGYLFKNRTVFCPCRVRKSANSMKPPKRIGGRSSPPFSAPCWNRLWTLPSAANSARITRPAPMSSGWSSRPC